MGRLKLWEITLGDGEIVRHVRIFESYPNTFNFVLFIRFRELFKVFSALPSPLVIDLYSINARLSIFFFRNFTHTIHAPFPSMVNFDSFLAMKGALFNVSHGRVLASIRLRGVFGVTPEVTAVY